MALVAHSTSGEKNLADSKNNGSRPVILKEGQKPAVVQTRPRLQSPGTTPQAPKK
jgi:hypothetical protein